MNTPVGPRTARVNIVIDKSLGGRASVSGFFSPRVECEGHARMIREDHAGSLGCPWTDDIVHTLNYLNHRSPSVHANATSLCPTFL
jgi:hypothetical protein